MRPAGYGNLARAVLYSVTAAATGWQVFRIMMWGVWGKPFDLLELVAIPGAFVLLYGAAAAFDGAPRSEAIAAALGCGLLWVFYAPALWNTFAELFDLGSDFDLVPVIPPILLVVSTIVVIRRVLGWRGEVPAKS
jgi:hypothetical protein